MLVDVHYHKSPFGSDPPILNPGRYGYEFERGWFDLVMLFDGWF